MIINPGLIRGTNKAPAGATAVFPFDGSVNSREGIASTFSRTTNAWNPETGAVAPNNIYTYSDNLAGAGITKVGVTAVSATVIKEDGTNGLHRIVQPITLTSASDKIIYQFKTKPAVGAKRWVSAALIFGGTISVSFDTILGTVGNTTTTGGTTLHSYGMSLNSDGYWDCWMVCTVTAASGNVYTQMDNTGASGGNSYQGDNTTTIEITKQQLSIIPPASSPTAPITYIPTTSAAVYLPRYLTGKSGQSVLMEESSSNLAIYSDDLSLSGYSQSGLLTADTGVSDPYGTTRIITIKEDSSNGYHSRYRTAYTNKAGANYVYTATAYAKNRAGSRNISLTIFMGASGCSAIVNPSTGAVVQGSTTYGTGFTAGSVSVSAWGSGWKITHTCTSNADIGIATAMEMCSGSSRTYAGDSTGQIDIGLMQLEQLAYPTSYIPTLASPVTRAAETLTFDPRTPVTLGSELVVNGDFSNGTTGYTGVGFSVVNGVGTLTSNGSSTISVYQAVPTVAGKLYKYTQSIDKGTISVSFGVQIGTTPLGFDLYVKTITTEKTVDAYFVATSSTSYVTTIALFSTAGQIATIDNVSVKEITSSVLNPTAGTIAGWMYVETAKQASTTGMTIFDQSTSGNANRLLLMKDSATNMWSFYTGNSGGSLSTSSVTSILSAGWHHIAATWGAAGTNPQLWIDGVLVATASTNRIPSALGTTANIGHLAIMSGQLDMPLDQLRIYPTALTAAQIAQLYRSGK